ncbi:MAG: Uma2 family endonuclease, partial [Cellulosilyticaceae bacterium]
MPLPQSTHKYTYADYLTWPTEERWEILDGIAYMQAAPSWQHQSISTELVTQFSMYLQGKSCKVFHAPFDLRLPESTETDETSTTVLQPDIVIICDKSKLQGTGYVGTPPLIVEILSPSTARHDKLYKLNKYESAGVTEYWMIEPDLKLVSVFKLQGNG